RTVHSTTAPRKRALILRRVTPLSRSGAGRRPWRAVRTVRSFVHGKQPGRRRAASGGCPRKATTLSVRRDRKGLEPAQTQAPPLLAGGQKNKIGFAHPLRSRHAIGPS